MKAAIYIEQGVTELAITPENEWERNILRMIADTKDVKTFWGQFYYCNGGWYRHGQATSSHDSTPLSEASLMFLIQKPKVEEDVVPDERLG